MKRTNEPDDDVDDKENPQYLCEQLITYIGNKRALLPFIAQAVDRVRNRLGKERISSFDVFSGSGVVSRYLKRHSYLLVANDLERYAAVINRCYLANRDEIDLEDLRRVHSEITDALERKPLHKGIVSSLYAPEDDSGIRKGERAFYTTRNARYLDTARALIETAPADLRPYLLAPLLAEASVHANTSGVFKGFYKDPSTGIGTFGGRKGDALVRITGNIGLPFPVFSNFSSDTRILSGDANEICAEAPAVDLAYLDPPYNQHPYGSNYFMLNLLAENRMPESISEVSGIPVDWSRSRYNRKRYAANALDELVGKIRAQFLVISFNSEGFITREEMADILKRHGRLETIETRYNAFRGSRNLAGRDLHVTEYLFILEKN